MAEPDRTNADAERVSDIVAGLRARSADAHHAFYTRLADNAALDTAAADIIEAQSKALAEAREGLEGVGELVEGMHYINERGDRLGPMRLVVEPSGRRTFLDQYGGIYEPNGFYWNHVEGSTANIMLWTANERSYITHPDLTYRPQHIPAALTPTPENPNG